jgi:hypothetical protein
MNLFLFTEEQLLGGNITGAQAMDVLSKFNKAVFDASLGSEHDPFACDVNGLTTLQCTGSGSKLGPSTIRAATAAGVFVPVNWLPSESIAYTGRDFKAMARAGLNTVVVPVPADWATLSERDLEDFVSMASPHVQVILQMVGTGATGQGVKDATTFANYNDVLALQLPEDPNEITQANNMYVKAARSVSSSLPLLIPVNLSLMQFLQVKDDNVFAALSMDHATAVADIASSNSLDDRMKLFYHEAISCMQRSPIEYSSCYRNMPVFISAGFDLGIDNCVLYGNKNLFTDYGQCDRFHETVDSDWWYHHRQSLAARQRFSFEQGLGWTYTAWKVSNKNNAGDSGSAIQTPLDLLSYRNVYNAGLLHKTTDTLACLNPPLADFVLGDKTLSPTPAPHDCGNGWWNESIQDCTYWVPPVTIPPTPCPTCEVCNVTAAVAVTQPEVHAVDTGAPTSGSMLLESDTVKLAGSFVGGAALAAMVAYGLMRRGNRRAEYSAIPS